MSLSATAGFARRRRWKIRRRRSSAAEVGVFGGSGFYSFLERLETVQLDTSKGFTAARARNAGIEALEGHGLGFVQMVDGDCALDAGWIDAALAAFVDEPDLAAFQRLRCAWDPDGLANPGKVMPTPRLCGEVPGPYRQHPLEKAGLAERF